MEVVLFIIASVALTTYLAIGFIAELRNQGGDGKIITVVGMSLIWGLALVATYVDMYQQSPRPDSLKRAWKEAWNELF